MIRAVVDTNVLISAFIRPESPPGQVVSRLVREAAFEMIASPAILEELERVPAYPRVRQCIAASDAEIDLGLAMLDTISTPVSGTVEVSGVARDADDDKILAAAVEGCAEYLVTGDQDLLALGEHDGVRIVTPRAFLELLKH